LISVIAVLFEPAANSNPRDRIVDSDVFPGHGRSRGPDSTPLPLLGQHTNEILTGPLRMPAAKVEKLRAAGVV